MWDRDKVGQDDFLGVVSVDGTQVCVRKGGGRERDGERESERERQKERARERERWGRERER